MQNRWAASRASSSQLASTSAASASSSSSSSSSALMDDDSDTRVVVHRSREAKVFTAENPEPKPTRKAKRSVADWRHLDFLEEKAQWAFDAKDDDEAHVQWLQNNSDFDFCDKHNELVEMIKFHPANKYNPECGKCLKNPNNEEGGVPLTAFFVKQHLSISSIDEAEDNWLRLSREKEKVQKENELALSKKQITVELAEKAAHTCSLLERSAFLWYYYLAWMETQHRIAAIRENAASPGNSSKFNMLPSTTHEGLVKFNHNCRVRGAKTAAGRSGQNTSNRRPCNIHQGGSGHMIHGYNKDRYLECGVCVKERDLSLTQKMLNDLGAGAQHPPIQFAAPKQAPKSKFRGPSAAAAARLTAPVKQMTGLSLADEAEMN